MQGLRQAVERPHDARTVLRHLGPVALARDEAQELLALELERLVGRDLRDRDVAGARLPLAVAVRALPRRLLVHRHLALELHVVEDDHLLAADDGHPAHLVRVEPRQVHVRDLPAREAQVAEDDVLDARREEVAPVRDALVRLLVEQVEDHREVVHAERPERVLVRPHDAEVLTVAVDAEHLAQLAEVDERLQLADARVIEQEMAGHQHEVALGRRRYELVDLGAPHRGRLLDEHMPARSERPPGQVVVRGHRRRDHHRVDGVVGQELVEVPDHPRLGVARGEALLQRGIELAERREDAEIVEVPRQVRPPVPEAGDTYQSLKTLSELRLPLWPVALRRSTTRLASSTTRS